MFIDRLVTPQLRRAFEQFSAVLLTGARQTGKTSLARHLLPEASYVTFDIPLHAELARTDPAGFLARYEEPLILDEVQYVPELLRHLKVEIDADRRPGRFFLTGSQDFLLMEGASESLAGRAAIFRLPALSMREAIRGGGLGDVDAFCWRGGFPELWQRPEMDRELWLGSYLATYLERDVRNALNVGNLRDFDRFLRACAVRAGHLLSMADIARDVGVAPNTAKSWISVLEASRQILLLEPYHSNVGKRLIKTPKLYFADTGLLLYLLGFPSWESVIGHASWGAIWENLVIGEVHKLVSCRAGSTPLWFWRTASGEEVDLLIERGPHRFHAIECKTTATVSSRDWKGMGELEGVYGKGCVERFAVVCRVAETVPLTRSGVVQAVHPSDLAEWLG